MKILINIRQLWKTWTGRFISIGLFVVGIGLDFAYGKIFESVFEALQPFLLLAFQYVQHPLASVIWFALSVVIWLRCGALTSAELTRQRAISDAEERQRWGEYMSAVEANNKAIKDAIAGVRLRIDRDTLLGYINGLEALLKNANNHAAVLNPESPDYNDALKRLYSLFDFAQSGGPILYSVKHAPLRENNATSIQSAIGSFGSKRRFKIDADREEYAKRWLSIANDHIRAFVLLERITGIISSLETAFIGKPEDVQFDLTGPLEPYKGRISASLTVLKDEN